MGSEIKVSGPNFREGVSRELFRNSEKLMGHIDGTPAVLIFRGGEYYAINAACTHYGANLFDGIITDEGVHCPWHHACFELKSGESKAPALSPITTWQTSVKGDSIYVGEMNVVKEKTGLLPKSRFIIVGSGASGQRAAEILRREGFSGEILMVSEDTDLPYDRPNLSKDYLAGTAPEEWMLLKDQAFYEKNKINVRLRTKVKKVDGQKKLVELSSGELIPFDKCLIATGGSPFKPDIPGIDLPIVHFLRSFQDCRNLIKSLESKQKVVVVGSGFIGLEAAAALRQRKLDVTIVSPDPYPLMRVFHQDVGSFLKTLHESNGVFFRVGSVGEINKSGVSLTDGSELKADVVLVATGIRPNTELAQFSGLECDNGICVNEYLQTNVKNIFAAGDVALFPYFATGNKIRVEHWVVAQRQAEIAAFNMIETKFPYREVPFFWSQQFDVSLAYIGYAGSSSVPKLYGDLKSKSFVVSYSHQDKVTAVLTCGYDRLNLEIEQALKSNDHKKVADLLSAI